VTILISCVQFKDIDFRKKILLAHLGLLFDEYVVKNFCEALHGFLKWQLAVCPEKLEIEVSFCYFVFLE